MAEVAKRLRVFVEPDPFPEGVRRPVIRGDCKDMPRPCPFVGCVHHLYLEVNDAGEIKFNAPGKEVWEMKESCSLDLSDRGGATLEVVGAALNLTRERVRQIESVKLVELRRAVPHLRLSRPGKRVGEGGSK